LLRRAELGHPQLVSKQHSTLSRKMNIKHNHCHLAYGHVYYLGREHAAAAGGSIYECPGASDIRELLATCVNAHNNNKTGNIAGVCVPHIRGTLAIQRTRLPVQCGQL